jgi:hypothetical protein
MAPAITGRYAAITASIGVPTAPAYGTSVGYACATSAHVSSWFDLMISAADSVNLSGVTIRLIDGSSVGGPTITFPSPKLAAQFGNTSIVAGTSRTFRFEPRFPCGQRRPYAVAADVVFVDHVGAAQTITVSKSL